MDYVYAALIVAGMFGFKFIVTTWQREGDICQQLQMLISELGHGVYSSEYGEHDGTLNITLRNEMSLIVYKRHNTHEHLSFSLFFKNAEFAGSNTTIVARKRRDTGFMNAVNYMRKNHLSGIMLYHVSGALYISRAHRLYSEATRLIVSHAKGTLA